MTKLYKYASINQFRHVTRNVTAKVRYDGKDENDQAVYDYNRVLPVLKFRGTVKTHGCVDGETEVSLANGDKDFIKNLEKGHSILSYNQIDKKIEYDTIEQVLISNNNKNWVELFFDNNTSIKCTSDHKFLTIEEGWIEAKDLNTNHSFIEDISFM